MYSTVWSLIVFRGRNSSQNYLSFSFSVFFMEFYVFRDFEWEMIKPLLLPRSRADDRIVLNGIL